MNEYTHIWWKTLQVPKLLFTTEPNLEVFFENLLNSRGKRNVAKRGNGGRYQIESWYNVLCIKEIYPSLNRYKCTSTLVYSVTMVTESTLERWTNFRLCKVYFALTFSQLSLSHSVPWSGCVCADYGSFFRTANIYTQTHTHPYTSPRAFSNWEMLECLRELIRNTVGKCFSELSNRKGSLEWISAPLSPRPFIIPPFSFLFFPSRYFSILFLFFFSHFTSLHAPAHTSTQKLPALFRRW